MRRSNFVFTSESVSEGHPDKVADRISDEVVDLFLGRAVGSDEVGPWDVRVAAETLVTTNRVIIAGEVRSDDEEIDKGAVTQVARDAIRDIGYEQDDFHWNKVDVEVLLHPQSEHIAQGVDEADEKQGGAGDQGIMFGYACVGNDFFMPAPIYYSHMILRELSRKRRSGELDRLGPDSKSQLSVEYRDGKPVGVTSIVVSHQHTDESDNVREMIEPTVRECLPSGWITDSTDWHVNPTGKFVIGGPDGDAGLTGRKIIVDTYGGFAPHGGGAFSGKDSTKVDRSAAYAARYLAKNIVAAGIADECTIQLSYAIGVAEPLSVYVDVGDSSLSKKLELVISDVIDLTPTGIRSRFGLTKPIFAPTSAYGHFGREPTNEGHFLWERTDLIEELKTRV